METLRAVSCCCGYSLFIFYELIVLNKNGISHKVENIQNAHI
jgi:hypothetical protein